MGPNTLILFFSKKSTIPSTKGFSGPTIIKSILFCIINFLNSFRFPRSISIFSAISDVPALPGKQKIFFTNFDFFKE